ncbi:MAG: HAD-IIIA family hydrolase [Pedobacter sp.]|nr:MAG: HAD-IIIA family hydrolase [Pedobacter sp.]
MKAVILAGGKGTRLGLFDKPKPMVQIGDKPLLEHQINLLKRYGITDIILLTGFLSEKIEEYFHDGSSIGVKLSYVREPYPLGTAGAVKQLENVLTERFLVLYGDIILDFDIDSFIEFDKQKDTIGTIIVHPNEHPYDSDLVEVDERCIVTNFLSKPHQPGLVYNNNVNAAVYILSPKIFQYIESGVISDFGKDIFPKVVNTRRHQLCAYDTPEYIKDLGTPDRLNLVTKAFLDGKIQSFNKRNKRPAIFIDRDGVVNKEVDNLRDINDFELLPDVAEAISVINRSDYLAILVTNQPGVAKGFITEDYLSLIHKKLETELGNKKSFLDRIYYCPHHPDKGFEGEVKELKINCNCRKPEIGMIEKAVADLNIDISKSFIIGDTSTDMMTGLNAGLKTVLVKTGYAGLDNKYMCTPDFVANDLLGAVNIILSINDN